MGPKVHRSPATRHPMLQHCQESINYGDRGAHATIPCRALLYPLALLMQGKASASRLQRRRKVPVGHGTSPQNATLLPHSCWDGGGGHRLFVMTSNLERSCWLSAREHGHPVERSIPPVALRTRFVCALHHMQCSELRPSNTRRAELF